jgi:hypothetical protein
MSVRALKVAILVTDTIPYDSAPFGSLSCAFLSALDPMGALAPFELFSLVPKR